MAADSALPMIIAVTLVVGGMAAAVGRHRSSPLRVSGGLGTIGTVGTTGMLGTGAIMLGALLLPDFSPFTAASLTIAVLLLVVTGVVAVRIRRRRPLAHAQRTTVAATVIDIAFMAAAVLLMPVHSAAAQLTSVQLGSVQLSSAQLTSAAQLGGVHSGGSHLALAGGVMIWLVLVAWAFCTAVLSVPGIRRHSPDGAFQLACSGCMITAMAAMAV